MNKPLVSILIPVYNRENLVKKAIDSALNQTYENIEIIAVDNKSTDGTYDVLKDYEAKYRNVKVYQNEENIGPVRNWKKCLEYSSGEFIKILFSDDWMDETFVEKCMEILLANKNVGFVYTHDVFHHKDKVIDTYRFANRSGIYDTHIFIRMSLYVGGYPVTPCNALFRREDVENNLLIGIPNNLGLEFEKYGAGNDILIFLLTALKYPYFGYISQKLIHFVKHEGSITHTNELCLYYAVSIKYFIDNFVNNQSMKKIFYAKLWLGNLKRKGKFTQLMKNHEVDMISVVKVSINYLKFKLTRRLLWKI